MRKIIGIAAALAATLSLAAPAVARVQRVSTSASVAPHLLSQSEMYWLIRGHTTSATTPEGQPISTTFNADGTYETVRGVWMGQPIPVRGTWSVTADGTVVRTGGVGPFQLREIGGRYYSTNTGREVVIK